MEEERFADLPAASEIEHLRDFVAKLAERLCVTP